MPRTKLDKLSSKSVKATTAQQPKPESVMDDFQVPDELRKQLEYPANVKKRQLAVEHAEKKLLERLTTINQRLKEDNTKVSVQRSGDSLALQATLPLKPGETSKDGKPNKQTKISLGIPFNLEGLKTAEEEARELGKQIARKTFVWNEKYLGSKAPKLEVVLTIGELLEKFEEKYFLTRKRNRQSESTFERHFANLKRYVNLNDPLNKDPIIKALEKTKAGSGARTRLVIALSVFCNTFDFIFDFKGYKNGYEAKKRVLPTDTEIEEKFYKFQTSKFNPSYQWQAWRWVYGMIATYGLRPHEVFAIHIESFTNPKNTLHELRLDETTTEGLKTGERTIFPLHPHWVELFDLKNVKIPKITQHFNAKSTMIAENFRSAKIGFPPYNLRHAYAIRGHELGIPLKEMADNMGHGVEMHTETYQKYMTIDSRRIVYQKAIARADEAKAEQTEVERLKAENAALKAEVESLRALLTKHQLEEVLTDK